MEASLFRRGASVVDQSNRTKLHFKGEQAFWFLDQLLTNRIEGIAPGSGAETLLLTPKGRIVAPLRALAAESSVFVDGPPGMGQKLGGFFEERVFSTKVEIRDRTDEFSILSIMGPEADRITADALGHVTARETKEQRDLGLSLPGDVEHDLTHFGSTVAVRVVRPTRGLDVWVVHATAPALLQALTDAGATQAPADDFAALCAFEGTPRFGVDYDDSFLPQEAALEYAVHFQKGCYLGQEAVAMAQRGRVKRRLRHLLFEGEPRIDSVMYEGAEVGKVTSVGTDSGTGRGIATIKTSVAIGESVHVGETTAKVAELPGTSEGPAGPSARELRERLQEGRTG